MDNQKKDIKAEVTPMMQQYLETKEQYSDCILFYRLGDFYEMFFEDAVTASKELELTLTGKSCGLEERAPMCGVPFHAAENYLNKLVQRGYKVAICEQVEDPKAAKGLVKREVIRVVTPGTNLDTQNLEDGKNNYLMSIAYVSNRIGISVADVTTGDYYLTECTNNRSLLDEIMKYSPSEIVCNDAFLVSGINIDELKNRHHILVNTLEPHCFDDVRCKNILLKHFHVNSLKGLGVEDFPTGVIASGALLFYLNDTQKSELSHFTRLNPYSSGKYMLIDGATRRNLELTETLRDKEKRGSLFWVLDKTKTAMGARALHHMIEQPLLSKDDVIMRLDAVSELLKNSISREEIREYLNPIYDLERLLGKISYKSANPRDLLAFKNSLRMIPLIMEIMKDFHSPLLAELLSQMDDLSDIYELINRAIIEEPPLLIREGGIIKPEFDENVDRFRMAKENGQRWISDLEEEDRNRTGIKNLKVKYNKVFGYYIEITNSFLSQVPDDYIRKQTLTNCERFTNPKLKEMEDAILNAEDKLFGLEYDIFCQIRDAIGAEVLRVQNTAKALANLDALCSLAMVAERNHYVRPAINEKGVIEIKEGRHPVVEQMISDDLFICNDTYLDNHKDSIYVITGPNMAGKSTYMRQVALITLMAQIGSFVPAKSANISLVDRIFTRVGASDDLASGQSTFMVEMNEVANILRNATKDSLLVLDEIGRGTSTFDGLSIAWAVIEHIANKKLLGAKTLFATHYHELTELEGKLPNVKNYCIAVKENGDDIVFLRKIIKGSADRSYGIQVAKIAGIPDMVTDRAKEILSQLVDNDILNKVKEIDVSVKNHKTKPIVYDEVDLGQMSLFDTVKDEDIIHELSELNISTLTPIDALNTLYSLQNKLKNRWM